MAKRKAKPVDTYRPMMMDSHQAASTVSPQEAEVNEYTKKIWDMYSGKESFDLSKMPNFGIMNSLYDGAKASSDRGRMGKGLAYGGDYDPNLIASIDEQNQSERERDAAGQIENWVGDTFAGVEGKMMGLAQSDQNRRDNNFNRIYGIYNTEAQMQAQKDAKPKWWQSLLGGAANVASGWATGGFKMPGSAGAG